MRLPFRRLPNTEPRHSAKSAKLVISCQSAADVILIDRNDVSMIPRTGDPAASVVLVGQPSHVKWVLVDGKVRKRDGRLVGTDIDKLQTLAQASHDYLIESAKLKSQN